VIDRVSDVDGYAVVRNFAAPSCRLPCTSLVSIPANRNLRARHIAGLIGQSCSGDDLVYRSCLVLVPSEGFWKCNL
jgi:hypothetical protein